MAKTASYAEYIVLYSVNPICETGCCLFWKELGVCRTFTYDRKLSCNPVSLEIRPNYCLSTCFHFVLNQHAIFTRLPITRKRVNTLLHVTAHPIRSSIRILEKTRPVRIPHQVLQRPRFLHQQHQQYHSINIQPHVPLACERSPLVILLVWAGRPLPNPIHLSPTMTPLWHRYDRHFLLGLDSTLKGDLF